MSSLRTGPDYASVREKYAGYLQSVQTKVNKTVDLFCRIKDTQQAEEVATVFYAVRQLKNEKQGVSEQDVFDYIIDWKKSWNTDRKRQEVASAIRNLVMLKWIGVEFSRSLQVEEDVL